MASHVVVIDTTFRRQQVKVNPGTYLSDVLDEACGKLNLKPSNYGFKHNNKVVDMSRTIRQSGLSSGAKLELIVVSRSPTVVSIALQLPQPLAASVSGGRIVDKFASNTTLWQILRAFEDKDGANHNFTGRGVAQVDQGAKGSGRIYYEMPVLNIMGRELSTFTDLQKTMGQLGISGGSSLIRLSFKQTDTPLEEAMVEIGQYFSSEVEPSGTGASAADNLKAIPNEHHESIPDARLVEAEPTTMMDVESSDIGATAVPQQESGASVPEETIVGPGHRPIAVYSAPSTSTPQAALQQYNEDDYEPTVAHAKLHQQRLLSKSQNVRLPSDAEAETIAKEKAAKQAAIKEVTIRVRFPDQSSVVATFNSIDTGMSLYDHARGVIVAEDQPFSIIYPALGGSKTVPKSSDVKLIKDLGFAGRILVNFKWDDGASTSARTRPVLKEQYSSKAQELKVPEVAASEPSNTESNATGTSVAKGKGTEGGKVKSLVPKWFKPTGKK